MQFKPNSIILNWCSPCKGIKWQGLPELANWAIHSYRLAYSLVTSGCIRHSRLLCYICKLGDLLRHEEQDESGMHGNTWQGREVGSKCHSKAYYNGILQSYNPIFLGNRMEAVIVCSNHHAGDDWRSALSRCIISLSDAHFGLTVAIWTKPVSPKFTYTKGRGCTYPYIWWLKPVQSRIEQLNGCFLTTAVKKASQHLHFIYTVIIRIER